jgi:hypothetical protein
VLLVTGLLAFGLADSTQAADFRGGENIVIGADEVIDDDLFVAGNRVEVNGTIKGDLFASGREVIVNGRVEGSLMIAGQTLRLNGPVGGSLYSGGYSLTIGPESDIGRNLFFGGFSLRTDDGSVIGRGLHMGGYQAMLNGDVAHDVNMGVGALELNGSVGGDVLAEVASPDDAQAPVMVLPGSVATIPPGFRMAESASVGGELDVQETIRAAGGPSPAQIGALTIARRIARRIGEFIALLIVGGLLLYYGPSLMQRASEQIQEQPLPSAGWGFLVALIFFIGVPIVAAVIVLIAILGGLITFGQLFGDILALGGGALAMVVAVFAFVLALVTKSIVTFLGGQLILDRLAASMSSGFGKNFLALAIGAFIYEILRAIPFGLGWVIGVIVTLVGLGAIYFVGREMRSPAPEGAAPATPAAVV